MNRRMLATLVVLTTGGVTAHGEAPPKLENPGFEQSQPGQAPAGWELSDYSRANGYAVVISAEAAREGRSCLELISPRVPRGFGQTGTVIQALPAAFYRGKRVRFRASARADVEKSVMAAGLYARVIRPGFLPGHWTEMTDQPIRAVEWREYSVTVDVAPDADRLEVGFLLSAAGKVWFDRAAVEVAGPAGHGNEPPRTLAGRGLDNLVALTRLLGIVRYFHPSDEAAAANWDRIAMD
jgi:hypothetical protein